MRGSVMEVVVRSATIMSIVCLDSLCMHSLCFYLFILFRPRLSLAPSSSNTTSGYLGLARFHRSGIHYTWRLPMPWKHPIDAALLCKAGTDGQLPCIDRWPMQAQGQICSITVFIIQCLPGSGYPYISYLPHLLLELLLMWDRFSNALKGIEHDDFLATSGPPQPRITAQP